MKVAAVVVLIVLVLYFSGVPNPVSATALGANTALPGTFGATGLPSPNTLGGAAAASGQNQLNLTSGSAPIVQGTAPSRGPAPRPNEAIGTSTFHGNATPLPSSTIRGNSGAQRLTGALNAQVNYASKI